MSRFLVWVFFCTCLCAQQIGGTLRGLVTDESGALVPGAKVTATGPGGAARVTTSGNDGAYSFTSLTPGAWTVQAASPGLTQLQPAAVQITSGTATLNLVLRVTLEKQEITVQENSAPMLSTDPSQNAGALVLRDDALDALSDDPDDLQEDLQNLAGPAAGPNGGQIYVDGFTNGDAALPNKDSIREIRINQNPFGPDWDRIGYGRIEILTKPGTDKIRGSAFFNYGNAIFNSRNPFAQEKAPFDLKEFGGNLSGPISKRSSFFLDLERRLIDSGSVINAVTLNPATLQIIDPFTQVFTSPLRRLRISPRVDYQLSPNNTLTIRYAFTGEDTIDTGVGNFNLVSAAYNRYSKEHMVQATETAVLSAHVVNETRAQYQHQNYDQDVLGSGPTIIAASAFTGGNSNTGKLRDIHHHFEITNTTTVVAGSHTWKFGARLRSVHYDTYSSQNFNGTFVFGGAYAPILDANNNPVVPGIVCDPATPSPGCATITSIEQYRRTLLFQQMGFSPTQVRALGGGATQFSVNMGTPVVIVGGSDIGAFIGDDWRVRPNITFSYGLRYEGQSDIHEWHDFGPRLAVAWAPGGSARGSSPKTVIRGGFGVFFDRLAEANVAATVRYNGKNQQSFTVVDPLSIFPNFPPILATSPQTIQTISPVLRAPYLIQSAIGVERQLPRNTTLAVTYTNSHGLHQFVSRNINAPLPGTYSGPGTGVYPYPGQGPIDEIESAGLYNQNQLVTNINTRATRDISLFGFYIFSKADSNTNGVGTFPANQYDLRDEYGPAFNDVRHRGSIGGSIATKWGIRVNPFIIVQSGAPFNIITSQDIYGSTILNARPGFADNPNKPGVVATKYGLLDPNPTPDERIVPRNFGRGPGQFTVNMRIGKVIGFGPSRERPAGAAAGAPPGGPRPGFAPGRGPGPGGGGFGPPGTGFGSTNRRYNLTISLSVRNLLNHVNPGPIIGNINSPLFGHANQIAGGFGAFAEAANNRRLELQMRLNF